MNILAGYSPYIFETYSIDESFLDFTGVPHDLYTYCGKPLTKVQIWTGIPHECWYRSCQWIAKKFPQLNGVHIIDTEGKTNKSFKMGEGG